MKKLSLFALTFVAILSLSLKSYAADPGTEILNKLEGVVKNPTLVEKICKKGSLFSGVVTIRSANGAACDLPEVAIFAESYCKEYDDYQSSQCHTKAVAALGKPDSLSRFNKLPSIVKKGICVTMKSKGTDEVKSALQSICG